MDKAELDSEIAGCFYPFGAPSFQWLGPGRCPAVPPSRQVSAGGIAAVAERLGRRVRFEDERGFQDAIVAGAVHPAKGWLAWVRCRCRCRSPRWGERTETGVFVEVELRLERLIDSQPTLGWPLECYNPYFGCHIRHLAWHGDDVVIIYREKHSTYACSLGLTRPARAVCISHDWLVEEDCLTYWIGPGSARVLSLPGLEVVEELSAEQARARGLAPPGSDDAEELRRWQEHRRRLPSPV
jgi:hypothetical protein